MMTINLPTVIIFEHHYDPAPKNLVTELLPSLAYEGYDTFCVEASHDQSELEITEELNECYEACKKHESSALEWLNRRSICISSPLSQLPLDQLANLLKMYVSSKFFNEMAVSIKQLPQTTQLKQIFSKLKRLNITIKGIDEPSSFYQIHSASGDQKKNELITQTMARRDQFFVDTIDKLNQKKEGVIFLCGAKHATALMEKFKLQCPNKKFLYYFPHYQTKLFDQDTHMQEIMTKELKEISHFLDCKPAFESLEQKIIHDIKAANIYHKKECIEDNSHIQFLSEKLNCQVLGFQRAGFYLDAFIPQDQIDLNENLINQLDAQQISFHLSTLDKKTYLTIANVNTREVAEKIRKL